MAKGRGGDHSEIGADDAERFCLDHGLSHGDVALVRWLVKSHLLMSLTAQKQDISDDNVIDEILLLRSEEHTFELQSLMRTLYAVFCWIKIMSYNEYVSYWMVLHAYMLSILRHHLLLTIHN